MIALALKFAALSLAYWLINVQNQSFTQLYKLNGITRN